MINPGRQRLTQITLHRLSLGSGKAGEPTGGQCTVIRAVRRKGAGTLVGKDTPDVVVDPRNSRKVSGCQRGPDAQSICGLWQAKGPGETEDRRG